PCGKAPAVNGIRDGAMAGGTHLELEERERLAALKAEGLSLRAIARALGRAASTVSRELRRNALPKGGYLPVHAEGCYLERRRRPAVGSIAKCESPTFAGVCTSEALFGPDLSPARPRRTTHPLPPHGSPPADRRDRRAARPAPVHHLAGAGAQPLPRRRSRVLRLLPPERAGPGAPTPAAPPEAGRRPRPA